MKEYDQVQKNFRSDENPREVLIGPRNLLTNPPKAGNVGPNTSFGGIIPYIEDDYERPKKLATLEREAGQKLMQDKPFSQKVKQTELFNSYKSVIGEDIPIPHRPPRKTSPPLMEHDKPFKPSNPPKLGYNAAFEKFPQYIEDPKKPLERKMEEEDEKPRFKPTHNSKSRPTPSV